MSIYLGSLPLTSLGGGVLHGLVAAAQGTYYRAAADCPAGIYAIDSAPDDCVVTFYASGSPISTASTSSGQAEVLLEQDVDQVAYSITSGADVNIVIAQLGALATSAAATLDTISASGSYATTNGQEATVLCIGGGGSGGHASGYNYGGGGGGSGYASIQNYVFDGSSVAVTVGAGATSAYSLPGGTTSFGAQSATGGIGGTNQHGGNGGSGGGAGCPSAGSGGAPGGADGANGNSRGTANGGTGSGVSILNLGVTPGAGGTGGGTSSGTKAPGPGGIYAGGGGGGSDGNSAIWGGGGGGAVAGSTWKGGNGGVFVLKWS